MEYWIAGFRFSSLLMYSDGLLYRFIDRSLFIDSDWLVVVPCLSILIGWWMKYRLMDWLIRVFAIYQIPLGWKTCKYYYETDELPNPRPTQPKKKWVTSGVWATFSHRRMFFGGLGLILYGNKLQETQPNQTLCKHPNVIWLANWLIGWSIDLLIDDAGALEREQHRLALPLRSRPGHRLPQVTNRSEREASWPPPSSGFSDELDVYVTASCLYVVDISFCRVSLGLVRYGCDGSSSVARIRFSFVVDDVGILIKDQKEVYLYLWAIYRYTTYCTWEKASWASLWLAGARSYRLVGERFQARVSVSPQVGLHRVLASRLPNKCLDWALVLRLICGHRAGGVGTVSQVSTVKTRTDCEITFWWGEFVLFMAHRTSSNNPATTRDVGKDYTSSLGRECHSCVQVEPFTGATKA